jgi:hypothetical protein
MRFEQYKTKQKGCIEIVKKEVEKETRIEQYIYTRSSHIKYEIEEGYLVWMIWMRGGWRRKQEGRKQYHDTSIESGLCFLIDRRKKS